MKSEDLSKDLQVNPRISPQTMRISWWTGWIEQNLRVKIDPTQIYSDLCSDLCSDLKVQLSIEYITSERKVGQTEEIV